MIATALFLVALVHAPTSIATSAARAEPRAGAAVTPGTEGTEGTEGAEGTKGPSPNGEETKPASGAETKTASEPAPPFVVSRGPGLLPLVVPRGETLEYDVEIDVGISDLDVGDVELSSGVEAHRVGLPGMKTDRGAAPALERAWVRSVARGSYLSYRLEHELKTRLLPQEFPALFHTDSQRGSENRNRELKIGLRGGERIAEFRSDTHCKGCANKEHFIESKWLWGDPEHCKKCKELAHRVWKDPLARPVPEGTLDMLSAVYLARSLVRDGLDTTTFPVIDRQKVWEVTVTRSTTKRIETEAGTFECQLVKLSTKFLAEQNEGEEPASKTFQGLFGIQGTIQIWLEVHTGVPVLIAGELPIPLPLVDHLDVRVVLKKYRGTPPEFRPVK